MNRITAELSKRQKCLSIYVTAGFPTLEDTAPVIERLQKAGVRMAEIGLPFSDPLADGATIQAASHQALQNGMSTAILFRQLENIRDTVSIPLIIMGYFNPIMQYGVENFCKKCSQVGIDGLIIPDLPVDIYQTAFKSIFEKYGLKNILLITPQTSEERIRFIDSVSEGFLYVVSSASTTGAKNHFDESQSAYFRRVSAMKLRNPLIAGFGISNSETFREATKYTHGAIIGSAFISHLEKHSAEAESIQEFVARILN